jgi:hypothetical protein
MAYFAKINDNNIVVDVVAVHNNELLVDGNESEQQGIDFLNTTYKVDNVNWKQTSYNTHAGVHSEGGTPLRKNYGGIGFTYDADRDAFISPKPYNSWILDETTCIWNSPVAMPEDASPTKRYDWNEENLNWEVVVEA